jgi:hypothetical protein
MNRSFLTRLDRLERARVPHGGPLLIVSTMLLPNERPTAETIAHWVKQDWCGRMRAPSTSSSTMAAAGRWSLRTGLTATRR